MIHPPSVVAIDDRADELNAIVQALRELDVACLPILVKSSKPNISTPLTGVRLVFFDINYLPAGTSDTQMYEVAATVLTNVLAPDNGPYVLITWSSKSDRHDELMAHFAKEVPELPAPAMSACLPKERFVIAGVVASEAASKAATSKAATSEAATSTGAEVPPEQPKVDQQDTSAKIETNSGRVASGAEVGGRPSLSEEIKKKLDAHPQLAALMQWERAARRASGDVVNSILDLFSRDARFKGTCGTDLEKALTHIASAAVGKENVKEDRRAAISEALTPILFDRLMHLPPSSEEQELWSRAMPLDAKSTPANSDHGAKLNALSLVAFPGQEPTKTGDRGAVFQLAGGVDEYFIQRTGLSKMELMNEFLEVSADGKIVAPSEEHFKNDPRWILEDFRWVLIGTRATCDQAQRRGTMSPAVLALEVPGGLQYGKKAGLRIKDHGAAMLTPLFACSTTDEKPPKNKRLVLNWHWVVSVGPKELDGAAVLYRLREPLINQISSTKSSYQARPGIVSFTPDNG